MKIRKIPKEGLLNARCAGFEEAGEGWEPPKKHKRGDGNAV